MKHRYILFFLLILLSANAYTQSGLKQFNGKTYNVYPLSIHVNNIDVLAGFNPYDLLTFGDFIPPCPEGIKEGDYVMLASSDSGQFVYATFVVKNGTKSGEALYFPFNDSIHPYLKVQYVSDELDGTVEFRCSRHGFMQNSEVSGFIQELIRNEDGRYNENVKHAWCDSFLMKLNFESGVLVGSQLLYGIFPNGQHLLSEFLAQNGRIAQCPVNHTYFYVNDSFRKISCVSLYNESGEYRRTFLSEINDAKIDLFQENRTIEQIDVYSKDKLKRQYHFYNGMERWRSYIDKSKKRSYYSVTNELRSTLTNRINIVQNFISIRQDESADTLFFFDRMVSQNFYEIVFGLKDTTLFGQPAFKFEDENTLKLFAVLNNRIELMQTTVLDSQQGAIVVPTPFYYQFLEQFTEPNQIEVKKLPVNQFECSGYTISNLKLSKNGLALQAFYPHSGSGQTWLKRTYLVSGDHSKYCLLERYLISNGNDSLELIDTLFYQGVKMNDEESHFNEFKRINPDVLDNIDHGMYLQDCDAFSALVRELLNFFDLEKVKHKTIAFNGIPFKGTLSYVLNDQDSNSNSSIDLNVGSRKEIKLIVHIKSPSIYKNGLYKCSKGHFDGKFKTQAKTYLRVGNYKNSKLNDKVTTNYGHQLKYAVIMRFENGINSGHWYFESEHHQKVFHRYFKSALLNGTQHDNDLKSHKLTHEFNVRNDTMHGPFRTYYLNGKIQEEGFFTDGKLYGQMCYYDWSLSNTPQMQSCFKFNNGRFVYKSSSIIGDSIIRTLEIDTVKSKLEGAVKYHKWYYDKIAWPLIRPRLGDFELNEYDEWYFEKMLNSHSWCVGTVCHYSKTTNHLLEKGSNCMEVHNNCWHEYYNPNGKLYRKYNFYEYVNDDLPSSFITYHGNVTAYYSNGNKMFEGFLLNKESFVDCESNRKYNAEDIFYTQFFDSNGIAEKPIGRSVFKEHYSDGRLICEGHLLNGKKDSLWRYYKPDGKLYSIGFYENGLKVGRWLSGDLSGINLPDGLCFYSKEKYDEWMELNSKRLNITERIYEKGILVSKEEFLFNNPSSIQISK